MKGPPRSSWTKSRKDHRDWKLISVAHEGRQPQQFGCHSRQRCSNQGLTAKEASVPGRRNHCPALHWRHAPSEENNKIFGQRQLFVAGSAHERFQFMVKDSTKYASTGGWGFGHFNERDGGKSGDAAVAKNLLCLPPEGQR